MGQQPQTAMQGTTGDRSTELAALIARLEKATGPDRELGNAVLLVSGWTMDEQGDGPARSIFWVSPGRDYDCYNDGYQPNPTASIDAALTLVPDVRWDWSVWHLCGHEHGAMIKAPDLSQWSCDKGAITPAIALCIAALKARLATTTGERSPVAHDPSNGRSLSKNQAD